MVLKQHGSEPVAAAASPCGATAGGFISVDDGGEFLFHESAAAVVADFEYPSEAAWILDRQGAGYRLAAGADSAQGLGAGRAHGLRLVPAAGATDFSWLRLAWLSAQHRDPRRYPLQRFYPRDDQALLGALFECLSLRHGPQPWPPRSIVAAGSILVDPYGHAYRPVKIATVLKPLHLRVVHAKPGAGSHIINPMFIEIEAASGTRKGNRGGTGQESVAGRPTVTGMPLPGVAGS